MLMAGTNITASDDTLQKISEEYLYKSIRHPKPHLQSEIRQLRIVYSLDAKQYSVLKKNLPYFVCGVFSPPFRRTENFAYIDRFVLDIDDIQAKGLDLNELKDRIKTDGRVLMCFSSPSEDGLKVMFRLAERCYDKNVYSIFYKEFLKRFSSQHGLEQVIDSRTCDVTRACFISMDEEVWYNPDADPVSLESYIDPNDPSEFFNIMHSAEDRTSVSSAESCDRKPSDDSGGDPDEETLRKIKARLNPKLAKIREAKEAFVPEPLNTIMDGLKKYIEDAGLTLTEIINIQYGKKLRMSLGLKQAEANLFFGKRGFTVVVSPRCGTDSELNNVAADLIRSYIEEIS